MIEVHRQCANTREYQRVDYVFEILLSILGLPWRIAESSPGEMGISAPLSANQTSLLIYYGDNLPHELLGHLAAGGGVIHIIRASSNTQQTISPKLAEAVVQETSRGFLSVVGFDLVVATWRCLSGLEGEMGALCEDVDFGDNYNQSRDLDPAQTPWVNQYLDVLLQVIQQGCAHLGLPLIQKWYWPGGKLFAASLSHDVDRIRRYREFFLLASQALRSLKLFSRFHFSQAMRKLALVCRLLVAPEDPLANFQRLLDLEQVHGFRSSFYFLGGPRWWRRYGARYNLRATETRRILSRIAEQGWEVGLHGSYYAYEAEGDLRQEKQELEALVGRIVLGHRQHYLHVRLPDAWRTQQVAGLIYDTTYGYRAKAGFKAGLCFPFFPYDAETESRLHLLELPLIFMDSNYSSTLSEQGWELIWPMLKMVKQHHGLITFNFHSCCVDKLIFPGWLELYARLLGCLHDQEAFVAPGAEIAAWWEQRNCLEFVTGRQTVNGTTWLLKAGKRIGNVCLKVYSDNPQPTIRVSGSVDYQVTGEGQTQWIKFKELAPGVMVEVEVTTGLGRE